LADRHLFYSDVRAIIRSLKRASVLFTPFTSPFSSDHWVDPVWCIQMESRRPRYTNWHAYNDYSNYVLASTLVWST